MSQDLASELSQPYADEAAEETTSNACATCRWLPNESFGRIFVLDVTMIGDSEQTRPAAARRPRSMWTGARLRS
jgi:hypothetical protein